GARHVAEPEINRTHMPLGAHQVKTRCSACEEITPTGSARNSDCLFSYAETAAPRSSASLTECGPAISGGRVPPETRTPHPLIKRPSMWHGWLACCPESLPLLLSFLAALPHDDSSSWTDQWTDGTQFTVLLVRQEEVANRRHRAVSSSVAHSIWL